MHCCAARDCANVFSPVFFAAADIPRIDKNCDVSRVRYADHCNTLRALTTFVITESLVRIFTVERVVMSRDRVYLEMLRTKHQGFTLIELMITVVVLSVLAAISIPSYRQYVIRGKRSAAQAVMMDIANREHQFLVANRAYADTAALGYTLPPDVSDGYTWEVGTFDTGDCDTEPCFRITFTGIAGQAAEGDMTLDDQGVKTPEEKWQR
jgi:type IV pilus assembly protein PilE